MTEPLFRTDPRAADRAADHAASDVDRDDRRPPAGAPAAGFPHDRLLRLALAGNAAFSTISGATLLLVPDAASRLLGGLPPSWLQLLGGSLVGFAVLVGFVASRSPVHPVAATAISMADLGWVIGSAIAIVVGADALGAAGMLVVGGVALAVAGFAASQLAGLRRYARNVDGRTSARSRFDFVRRVPGDADLVWSRLRALDRIGEFFPDLTEVRVEDAGGVTRRTCGIDESQWSEEVVVMNDAARELVLQFDLSAGRAPFPATEMIGGWVVEPTGGGSTVHLWYEYTIRWGWIGEIVAALMVTGFGRQLAPVVARIGRPAHPTAPTGAHEREVPKG